MNAPALPSADRLQQWGVDPGWSQLVEVAHHGGSVHTWHVLDRSPPRPVATLVCVHGNPTWSYLWHHLVARLGDRYRVIAVDQLGMGFSERTESRRYAQRVVDLADVIRSLHVSGPVITVGHDWGGAISLGWAVAAEDRTLVDPGVHLAGVVLCNTGIAVPAGRSAPRLIRLAASGPLTSLVGHRTRTFVDGTIGLSFRRLTPSVRDALRAPYRRAVDRRAIADFVDDVPFRPSDPSAAAIAIVAEGARALTVPTLLAWGAVDPVFDDSFALDLAQRIPHSDRHRFPGSGHLSPLESDVAGAVDAWLTARLGAGPLSSRTAPLARATITQEEPAAYVPSWSALQARRNDHAAAFVDGATGTRISFADLHTRVMRTAAGLRAVGVQSGQRIALLVPPGIDLVTVVYACWRTGAVTVIADRGLGLRGLGRAVRGAHVEWMIGVPPALAAARTMRWAPGARSIVVGSTRAFRATATLHQLEACPDELPTEPSPTDLAAVLYTSGATGPAKGVRYTHRQLAAQRDALASTYAITTDDRLVAAFAPFALYGPALGITSTIPDVDVTKPASLTADALGAACAAIDATIVFASPAALTNANATSTAADPRLATVRLVLSAGAPVRIATLRSTRERIPSAAVHTPYGMTECLPVADVSLTEIEAAGPGVGVCVGHPVAGVDVRIVPLGFRAGAPIDAVPVGTTGEVLVRSPWCSDGYDQLWLTEHEARPVDPQGIVWHRSGDVGHVDRHGRLWIEGRSVHVVHSVAGAITPVPVEIAVEGIAGVHRSAAVGVGPIGCQQLVVVIEDAAGTNGLAADELTAKVRAAVAHPVAAVLTVGALPVDIRHNTKIDRTAVARWSTSVLSGARSKPPW